LNKNEISFFLIRYEIFRLERFGDGGVEYEKEIDFQLIKAIAIAAHFIPYTLR
jgi:hypothetical protein